MEEPEDAEGGNSEAEPAGAESRAGDGGGEQGEWPAEEELEPDEPLDGFEGDGGEAPAAE